MSRIYIFLSVLIGLPIVALVTLFLVLDNPKIYQKSLESNFAANTDFDLKVKGELNWRFWPLIAIEVNDIVILPKNQDQAIASLDYASIDIELIPLLTKGKLAINGISIDGLTLNAKVDKQNHTNWQSDSETTTSQTKKPSAQKPSMQKESTQNANTKQFEFAIANLNIKQAKIDYEDLYSNVHYTLSISEFNAQRTNTDKASAIKSIIILEDHIQKIKTELSINGNLGYNTTFTQFELTGLLVDAKVDQNSNRFAGTASLNGSVNIETGEGILTDSSLTLAGVTTKLQLTAKNLLASPSLTGHVSVEEFNAIDFASKMSITLPDFENKESLTKLAIEADIKAIEKKFTLSNIVAKFDDSRITGQFSAILRPSPNKDAAIETALKINGLDMDKYTLVDATSSDEALIKALANASTNTTPSNKGSSTPSISHTNTTSKLPDFEIIPIDTLRRIDIIGALNIQKLTLNEYHFENVKANIVNRWAKLNFNASATAYDGKINLKLVTTNVKANLKPTTIIDLAVDTLDIAKAVDLDSVTGQLNVNTKLQFSGNMMSQLSASLMGKSDINIANGTLNITPLKSLSKMIGNLQSKTYSIDTWPDMLPFEHLKAQHQFVQGLPNKQTFYLDSDNVVMTGKGGYDYFADTINYKLKTKLKENMGGQFTVNSNIANINWPLQCQGTLDKDISDLCLPNQKAINKMGANVAKQALQKKGEDKLLEKVPDEYKKAAKQLLKGLFN